jgi:hypothetical protein
MLICIPVFSLARFDLVLPLRILVVILVLLNAGTGVLVYRMVRRVTHHLLAGLAALFWVFWPGIHAITTQQGMESGVNAFFIMLLLERISAREISNPLAQGWKPALKLGIFGVLALFSRLDNIFVVTCAGIWVGLRQARVREITLAYLLAAVISVLVSNFLRLGFGSAYLQYLPSVYWMLALGVSLKLVSFFLAGLFGSPRPRLLDEGLRLVVAVAASTLVMFLCLAILNQTGIINGYPRAALLYDLEFTLVLAMIIRLVIHWRMPPEEKPASPLFVLRQNLPAWLKSGVAYFAPLIVLVAIYMLWNLSAFGTPMPVSGQVKHWWGIIPDVVYGKPVNSFAGLFGFPQNGEQGSWWLAMGPANAPAKALTSAGYAVSDWLTPLTSLLWLAICAGLVALNPRKVLQSIRETGCPALLAGCLLQILYYGGTFYVNIREWYWINQTLVTVLLGTILLNNLVDRLVTARGKLVYTLAVGTVSIALPVFFFIKVALPYYQPDHGVGYRQEAKDVMAATEPGSVIGMTGGGVVAYFIHDRVVVNLDGLINSYDYFLSMKNNQARDTIDRMQLDYVYANEYIVTSSNPYRYSLKDRLTVIKPLGEMVLFRYGAVTPSGK